MVICFKSSVGKDKDGVHLGSVQICIKCSLMIIHTGLIEIKH